jgi:c-di-AMP phosphodiesterase-like protein
MQRLLRYLELILTSAGILIVAIVFLLFHNIAPWKAAAICAVAVAVLHGLIFFAVRSAQRRARNEAIDRVRRQLDDLVRNKLQVVLCATELNDEDWRPVAQFAIQEIGESLDRIEMEAVSAATYR